MKQHDNHRALYDAVSDIDSILIEEAISPGQMRTPLAKRVVKYAATAAAVFTFLVGCFFAWLSYDGSIVAVAPGILSVASYSIDDDQHLVYQPLEENESVYFPAEHCLIVNIVPGMPFSFYISEDDIPINLNISINAGQFDDWICNINKNGTFQLRETMGYLGKDFSIPNNRTIYWDPFDSSHSYSKIQNAVYMDIILYSESHIVGYCVIEISCVNPDGLVFTAKILQSAYYPPQDGEYQEVSESYIRKKILQAKILK